MKARGFLALLYVTLCLVAGCGGGSGSGTALRELQHTASPDGTRVAFVREVNPRDLTEKDLYVRNADGTNERRIYNSAHSVSLPIWSPDGSKLAFLDLPTLSSGFLVTLDMSTLDTRQIHSGIATPEQWTADHKIVFRELVPDPPFPTQTHRFQIDEDGSHLVHLGVIP